MNMVWHASHNNALVIHLILLPTNQPRIFYYTLCYDPVTQFQSSCDSCVHLWRSSNAKGFVIGDVAFISSTEIYFALPSKRHKRLYFQTITRMPSEREWKKQQQQQHKSHSTIKMYFQRKLRYWNLWHYHAISTEKFQFLPSSQRLWAQNEIIMK